MTNRRICSRKCAPATIDSEAGAPQDAFGIHPVRAVLFETTNEARHRKLIKLTNRSLVTGPNKRFGLLWSTISTLLTGDLTHISKPLERLAPQVSVMTVPLWLHPAASLGNLPTATPRPRTVGEFPKPTIADR
jgi:hypothetical protein